MSLAMARERAREKKDAIDRGVDPVEQRRATKAALVAARKRGLTFRQAVDKYLKGEGDAAGKRAMAGKWVMGLEKAAYRGGCRSLPEPPEGAIRHEGRYHDHPASPARFACRPADGDRARRRVPDFGGRAEGRGGKLHRPIQRRSSAGWAPAGCPAWRRSGANHPDRGRADPGRAGRRCGTGRPTCRPRRRSASPRASCQGGRGARGASMPCCRSSTCAASRPETFRRRWPRCSGPMRRTCRQV